MQDSTTNTPAPKEVDAVKSNKPNMKVLLVVIILLVIVAVFGINSQLQAAKRHKEAKIAEEMNAIGAEVLALYKDKQFDQAIEKARELEKPYSDYYIDFIEYAKEISKWEGTGEELYHWLEDFYEFYETSGYEEIARTPKVIGYFWRDIDFEKEEFDNKKALTLNAFSWTTEYNEMAEALYKEFFNIVNENRELFNGTVHSGKVQISKADMEALDAKLEKLYVKIDDRIKEFQNTHKGYELFDKYIESELEIFQKFKEEYYENYAASAICKKYDGDSSFVYVPEKDAATIYKWEANHAMLSLNLVTAFDIARCLRGKTDERQADYAEDVTSYKIATYDIYTDVIDIFDYVAPTIKEDEYTIDPQKICTEIIK